MISKRNQEELLEVKNIITNTKNTEAGISRLGIAEEKGNELKDAARKGSKTKHKGKKKRLTCDIILILWSSICTIGVPERRRQTNR